MIDPYLKMAKDEFNHRTLINQLANLWKNPLLSLEASDHLEKCISVEWQQYGELFPVHYLTMEVSHTEGVPPGFRVLETKVVRPYNLEVKPFTQILLKGDNINRPVYLGNDTLGYRMTDTVWKWETPSLVWGDIATKYGKRVAKQIAYSF
jgi:hypothetical protein